MTNAADNTPSTQTRTHPNKRRYQPTHALEQYRAVARFLFGAGAAASAALLTAGLALVGVYTAVHFAFTQHGLDPAAANSLGDGIDDAINHLNPVFYITGLFTLAAMITRDVLSKTIRTRQAPPINADPGTTPTKDQKAGPVHDPSPWDNHSLACPLSYPAWETEHHPELGPVIRIGEEQYLPVLGKDGYPVLAIVGPTREEMAAVYRRYRQENP